MSIPAEQLPTTPTPVPVASDPQTYVERVETVIEDHLPDDQDFAVHDVAEQVLRYLETYEPYVLQRYMQEVAALYIARTITDRLVQRRRAARNAILAEEAADRIRTGTPAPAPFDATFVVGPGNVRRPVARMTATDHSYVADSYEQRGRSCLMEAAFHRAVARKLAQAGPDASTEEVMDEATYAELYRSIVGSATVKVEYPGQAEPTQ